MMAGVTSAGLDVRWTTTEEAGRRVLRLVVPCQALEDEVLRVVQVAPTPAGFRQGSTAAIRRSAALARPRVRDDVVRRATDAVLAHPGTCAARTGPHVIGAHRTTEAGLAWEVSFPVQPVTPGSTVVVGPGSRATESVRTCVVCRRLALLAPSVSRCGGCGGPS